MTTEEIEYIEPTQEHVGQMVEVRQAEIATHRQRKLLAVLPHPIKYRFVCQDSVDAVSSSLWQFARIARPLTYAERQARCGLKVGDRVRFVREWQSSELGTTLEYISGTSGMNKEVGQVGLLTYIGKEYVRVEFGKQYWYLPYFVLEKVETQYREIQCDIGAKVVRINLNNKTTEYTLHNIFVDSDGCKFGVVKDLNNNWDVIELCDLRIEVQ